MTAAADPALVIATARAWMGTPYHDQASLKGVGCDCLGLARGVWRDIVGREPEKVPAYSRDWSERSSIEVMAAAARRWMIEVEPEQAGAGDLVLFRMRSRAVAKHCGILTGLDPRAGQMRFIHAYDRLGVMEEYLTRAWQRRIVFAFRYPAGI